MTEAVSLIIIISYIFTVLFQIWMLQYVTIIFNSRGTPKHFWTVILCLEQKSNNLNKWDIAYNRDKFPKCCPCLFERRALPFIGGISRLPVIEMSWKEKSKKNLGSWTTFVFYSILKSQILTYFGYDTNLLLCPLNFIAKKRRVQEHNGELVS